MTDSAPSSEATSQQPNPRTQSSLHPITFTNGIMLGLKKMVDFFKNPIEVISKLRNLNASSEQQEQNEPQQEEEIEPVQGYIFQPDPRPFPFKIDAKKQKIKRKDFTLTKFMIIDKDEKPPSPEKFCPQKLIKWQKPSPLLENQQSEGSDSNRISQILPNQNEGNSNLSLSMDNQFDFGNQNIKFNSARKSERNNDDSQPFIQSGQKFNDEISINSDKFDKYAPNQVQSAFKKRKSKIKMQLDEKIINSFYASGNKRSIIKSKLDRIVDDDFQGLSYNPYKALDNHLKNNENRKALEILRKQEKKRLQTEPRRLQLHKRVLSLGYDIPSHSFGKKRSEHRHFTINELYQMLKNIKKDEKASEKASQQQGQFSEKSQRELAPPVFSSLFQAQDNQSEKGLFADISNSTLFGDMFKKQQKKVEHSLGGQLKIKQVQSINQNFQEKPQQEEKQKEKGKEGEKDRKSSTEKEIKSGPSIEGSQPVFDQLNPPEGEKQSFSLNISPPPSPKNDQKQPQTPQKAPTEQVPPSTPTKVDNPFLKSPKGLNLIQLMGGNSSIPTEPKKEDPHQVPSVPPSLLGTPRNSIINNSMCDESEEPDSANVNHNISSNIPFSGSMPSLSNPNSYSQAAANMFSKGPTNLMGANPGGGFLSAGRSPPPPTDILTFPIGIPGDGQNKNLVNMFLPQPQDHTGGLFGPAPTPQSSGKREKRSRKRANEDRIG